MKQETYDEEDDDEESKEIEELHILIRPSHVPQVAKGKLFFVFIVVVGDRIMGLYTPSRGNTSHGYYTPNGRKVSGASIFFESFPYKVNRQTGYIEYEKLEERGTILGIRY